MAKKPLTHADAELTLRFYEIRREASMRQSRDIINSKFWPDSYDDLKEVLLPSHPFNVALRQTASYWEMVYGMARNGIIDADYLMENNGEGLVLFAKIEPYLEQLRQEYGDTFFQNVDWITKNCETGRKGLERIRSRVQKMRELSRSKG